MDYKMELFWLGHACFKIKTFNDIVIYLDPYELSGNEEKADVIVSSHSHFDHFSASDIKKVMKDDTVLLGPLSMEKNLKKLGGKGLKIGEPFSYKELKIELFPAYTIKKSSHPKSNQWAGTIIEWKENDMRVYHAGDTERIPEMKDLASRNITVALIPCGGTYTMDFKEATDAALDIKPQIVIPMHTWGKNLDEFKAMMARKDPNIAVEILENKSLKV